MQCTQSLKQRFSLSLQRGNAASIITGAFTYTQEMFSADSTADEYLVISMHERMNYGFLSQSTCLVRVKYQILAENISENPAKQILKSEIMEKTVICHIAVDVFVVDVLKELNMNIDQLVIQLEN